MRYQKSEDRNQSVQAVNRLLDQLEVSLGQGEPAKQEFVEVIQIMKELVSETGMERQEDWQVLKLYLEQFDRFLASRELQLSLIERCWRDSLSMEIREDEHRRRTKLGWFDRLCLLLK